jgi:hypothetical protein
MTGALRGKTLVEKLYGPGFRPVPHREAKAPWSGCGVEGCIDAIHGSIELYVDDLPPALDWYTRLLARLPQNVWTAVSFCEGHLKDVIQRSVYDMHDEPDFWAPWRASPPVLTHPPKLLAKPKLILP